MSAAAGRVMWLNGRLLPAAEAALSLLDRGARDGEGLFETIRVESGRPAFWSRHLERLVLAAAELGFPVPPSPAAMGEGLSAVLDANGLVDAAARITVTRGVPGGRPTRAGCWIEVEPLAARLWRRGDEGAIAVTARAPFLPGPYSRYKTTSRLPYAQAREEARARGADEAILVSPDGVLLEGSTSNLFLVRDGVVATTTLGLGILPGIARRRTLERCAALGLPAREAVLVRADLERAQEVFLTNAIQQVVPVARLDGLDLGPALIGPRLRAAFADNESPT